MAKAKSILERWSAGPRLSGRNYSVLQALKSLFNHVSLLLNPKQLGMLLAHLNLNLSSSRQALDERLDHLPLFCRAQAYDGHLNDRSDAQFEYGDEALIIHADEEAHNELTVHSISDTAMPRDRFAEVFDVESPLQPRGKESSKWSD